MSRQVQACRHRCPDPGRTSKSSEARQLWHRARKSSYCAPFLSPSLRLHWLVDLVSRIDRPWERLKMFLRSELRHDVLARQENNAHAMAGAVRPALKHWIPLKPRKRSAPGRERCWDESMRRYVNMHPCVELLQLSVREELYVS